MKKILTLALAAMVACASYAQSPKSNVRAEKSAKAIVVNGLDKSVKVMSMEDAKAYQEARVAKAAEQQSRETAKSQNAPVVSFFAKSTISAPAGFVAPKGAKAESNYELVEPSAEVIDAAEEWNMRGTNWFDQSKFTRIAVVAVVDGEIYIQGLSPDVVPNAWLKGTIAADGTVSFPQFTFAGSYGDYPTVYFCNIQWNEDGEFAGFGELTGTYDAETETFTFTSDVALNTSLEVAGHFGTQAIAAGSFITKAEIPAETGDPVDELPFNAVMSDPDMFAQFGVIDANNDGHTWSWSSSNNAYYGYSSKNSADDYLISPAIKVEAGKNYDVTINTKSFSGSYPERVEVLAGTAPKVSAFSISVIPPTEVATSSAKDIVGRFTAPETGYYHFAIHAISDADQYNLYINSFVIEEGPDPKAPQAVENLVITPGEKGVKVAVVEFTSPTKSLDGENLVDSSVEVEIYANDVLTKVVETTAGSNVSVTLDGFEQSGMYKFTVITKQGELVGDKALTDAYIGYDVPECPTGLKVVDCGDHIKFTWNKCGEEGANGGYVDPSMVSYQVWECADLIPGWGIFIPNVVLCDPLLDTDTYDYEFDCNTGTLGQYVYAIYAQNEAGKSSLNDGGYGYGYFGTPLDIPARETFADGGAEYDWFTQGNANLYADLVAEGSVDAYSIEVVSEEDNEVGGLISTKFSLAGSDNASVTADMYTTKIGTTVTLFVEANGEATPLQTYELTGEWATYTWNVSAYANEPAVRFRIIGNFPEAGSFLFDNFNVLDLYKDNLVAKISAPESAVTGQTVTITVNVQNLGENVAEDYLVKVYADDTLVEAIATKPLSLYESTDVFAFMSTSIFDEPREIVLKAVVDYAPDLKPEDNTATTTLSLVAPNVAPVGSITATVDGDEVKAVWTLPDGSLTEVVEDFESYDEFAYIKNGEHLGGWTGWDLDGGMVYGWSGGNWPHAGTTGAFGIFNPAAIGLEAMELPSGEQTALIMDAISATCTGSTASNDDWMVSPELPGVSQTISFMVSELADEYGDEKFQVLASTTGNTPECFELVAEGTATMAWKEFTADLPEGTKYFAIRCISVDAFGMLIDDVKYTSAGGIKPTGFNVYLDQVKVASVNEMTYTVSGLADGEHTISVTATYGKGESSPVSAVFVINNETGIDNIEASAAKEIYTVNGVRVSEAKNAGVYIVNGQKVVIK